MIQENLLDVERKLQEACHRSGRHREEVTLIAVSKTKPIELIQEAIAAHLTEFGENKVQELCEKMDLIQEPVHWHMIGHLQKNKVKYIVGRVACIHSVDSIELAEQISKEAVKKQVECQVLAEINISGELSKFGISPEETENFLRKISKFPNLRVRGLMTVAPFTENAEENRTYFRQMKQLSVDINAKNIDNITIDMLSMGMTGDYEVAVEEGATHIRVGTGIFGERNYH